MSDEDKKRRNKPIDVAAEMRRVWAGFDVWDPKQREAARRRNRLREKGLRVLDGGKAKPRSRGDR